MYKCYTMSNRNTASKTVYEKASGGFHEKDSVFLGQRCFHGDRSRHRNFHYGRIVPAIKDLKIGTIQGGVRINQE
jgi:hypothetical protein